MECLGDLKFETTNYKIKNLFLIERPILAHELCVQNNLFGKKDSSEFYQKKYKIACSTFSFLFTSKIRFLPKKHNNKSSVAKNNIYNIL